MRHNKTLDKQLNAHIQPQTQDTFISPKRMQQTTHKPPLVQRVTCGLSGPGFLSRRWQTRRQSSPEWMRGGTRNIWSIHATDHTQLLTRSGLGLIAIYNLLPETVVAESEVSWFQRRLQEILASQAYTEMQNWSTLILCICTLFWVIRPWTGQPCRRESPVDGKWHTTGTETQMKESLWHKKKSALRRVQNEEFFKQTLKNL